MSGFVGDLSSEQEAALEQVLLICYTVHVVVMWLKGQLLKHAVSSCAV